jgi:hypothetical protein
VWIYTDSLLGINTNKNSLPENFVLHQNYPNPFNPSTIINYELQITNYVRLDVFNIEGKLIDNLVNKNQEAGKYEIEFNAENLPSGVYFYKLTIGYEQLTKPLSITKKMVLLK